MSFSDAISQVSQIQAMEQQLFSDPTSLVGGTATGGTTATDDTTSTSSTDSSSSAFATALADAQSSDATSVLSSAASSPEVDDTAGTDSSASDTTDASDLLSGGDSQLLSALSSMGATGTDGTDADTDTGGSSSSSSSIATALESALESSSGSTSPDGTSNSSLVSALETALESSGAYGTTAIQTDSGVSGGTATSSTDPRIQAMTEEANALVGQSYVYGGGHDGWGAQSGYDCSGFVSAVLHAGGYLSTPQDTTTLPSASGMESGAGQYVTIYDRDAAGKQGHVIIDIDGQFYESGGSHGTWGGGGGVEEISTPSAAYLSTFNTVLHPEGL